MTYSVIHRYAVVPEEADSVADFVAVFDDETVAEAYCKTVNLDSDYGCTCTVVRVTIGTGAITEE